MKKLIMSTVPGANSGILAGSHWVIRMGMRAPTLHGTTSMIMAKWQVSNANWREQSNAQN